MPGGGFGQPGPGLSLVADMVLIVTPRRQGALALALPRGAIGFSNPKEEEEEEEEERTEDVDAGEEERESKREDQA